MRLTRLLEKVDIINGPKDKAADVSAVCYNAEKCVKTRFCGGSGFQVRWS